MKRSQEARISTDIKLKGNPNNANLDENDVSKETSQSKSSSTKKNDFVEKTVSAREAKTERKQDEENFEGDYFKDFYYAQGDYNKEKMEEVAEITHGQELLQQEKQKTN